MFCLGIKHAALRSFFLIDLLRLAYAADCATETEGITSDPKQIRLSGGNAGARTASESAETTLGRQRRDISFETVMPKAVASSSRLRIQTSFLPFSKSEMKLRSMPTCSAM